MGRRPQFKRCFRYEVVPSEGVFLLSEKEQFVLKGSTYIHLAPFLNGQYTESDLVKQLKDQIPAPELFYMLELLRRRGCVVDACPNMLPEQASFWDMLNVDPTIAKQQLQKISVSLISMGQVDTTPLQIMLETLNINVVSHGERSIVVTDDYLQTGLDAFNQKAVADNHPWMLLKPIGIELWLGPIFMPEQTACWHCLAHRLRGHRKVENYLEKKINVSGPFPVSLSAIPPTLQTAFSLATTEIAKWLVSDENNPLINRVMTLDVLSLEKNDHWLIRRPQCPTCGQPDIVTRKQAVPLQLQSQKKSFTADGGHRSISPEETFEKLKHHLSPITGLISTMQQVSPGESGNKLVTFYVTDHNFALADQDANFMHDRVRSRSAGKGKLDIQAKASALGESIERYSGVFQGDEARIKAKLKDLNGAIHPNACMLFSKQQFKNYKQWNEKGSRFNWVPEPFDEDLEIEWSPVWSLTRDEPRYIPTAYCYYGYAQQHGLKFTRADANGCAAGNNKEEAIVQGFLELIERDSVALWWYNRLKKPSVQLSSFDEPYFQELQTYHHLHQRDLWVLDLTSDLNIPTFAAISRRNDKAVEDIIFAFGCHFDPHIAILRALTELNQMLPIVFEGTPNAPPQDQEAVDWWANATLANEPYLLPDASLPLKLQSDYPKLGSDDLYSDVLTCIQIVQDKGLELLVLDQTRPDTSLHVVKVIVPGLRHFWARFGLGRLYDVPVQMGYLAKPLAEKQLNPKFIFL